MSPGAEGAEPDEVLLAELRAALASDPEPPAGWREAARGAYAWRTIDQELLELTYDSRTEGGAAVRSATDTRVLEFTGGELALEVELVERRVSGRLTGPEVTEVGFESADGRVRSSTLDESGFFTLDGEDHGLVRFSVQAGGTKFVTEWILL